MRLRALWIAFKSSSTPVRPARLIQGDRGIDKGFRPYHRLYLRLDKEDVADGQLIHARIKHDGASSNWSKYSLPWDVIFDHPKQGILQYIVCGLPKEIPKKVPEKTKPNLQTFRPVHDPLPMNYPHSEIQAFHGSQRTQKLGELAKKEFRTLMARRGVILQKPAS